jgi:hypothetical protein
MPANSAKILEMCRLALPHCTFAPSTSFYWSPRNKTIHIDLSALNKAEGQMALLHEVGHAILNHSTYTFDAELVSLEAAAWYKATEKAKDWSIAIDAEHIEDCLDTYRDWLYARSTCPTCSVNAPQPTRSQYKCINCGTTWSVSPSRFCRPYRMQSRAKKIPSQQSETVFS